MLLTFALLGTACSGGDDAPADGPAQEAPSDRDAAADSEEPAADPPADSPVAEQDDRYSDVGDGVAITMARSDDTAGRFQAEVVQHLLQELGYAVNEPADLELSAADFYDALGRGEVDLWANARFPDHEPHLDALIRIEPFVPDEPDATDAGTDEDETDDAQTDEDDDVAVVQQPEASENAVEILVRDELTVAGIVVPTGSVAGFVTNVSIALDNPGLTLDALIDDEELFARYDAADGFLSPALAPDDAAADDDADQPDADDDAPATDGVIHILGCPEDAVCADQIDEMIRFAGWRRELEQVHGDRDILVEEALRRIAADQPVIVFLRGPSAELTQLIPGENVMWLAFEPDSVLDGSITNAWDQRHLTEEGEQLPNPVAADTCTTDPCHLGWRTNEIAIAARTEFLERHPVAAALLERIEIPATDIENANARVRFGDLRSTVTDKTSQAADEWIETNRDLVDGWLAAAVAAG